VEADDVPADAWVEVCGVEEIDEAGRVFLKPG
jgi:hypothetical protein